MATGKRAFLMQLVLLQKLQTCGCRRPITYLPEINSVAYSWIQWVEEATSFMAGVIHEVFTVREATSILVIKITKNGRNEFYLPSEVEGTRCHESILIGEWCSELDTSALPKTMWVGITSHRMAMMSPDNFIRICVSCRLAGIYVQTIFMFLDSVNFTCFL
jgi:hypothetical protein